MSSGNARTIPPCLQSFSGVCPRQTRQRWTPQRLAQTKPLAFWVLCMHCSTPGIADAEQPLSAHSVNGAVKAASDSEQRLQPSISSRDFLAQSHKAASSSSSRDGAAAKAQTARRLDAQRGIAATIVSIADAPKRCQAPKMPLTPIPIADISEMPHRIQLLRGLPHDIADEGLTKMSRLAMS